jgi:hypothetical protein
VTLGQIFSEHFGFPCQFLFHRLLDIHQLPSRAGTIGQLVTDVPSGLTLTPPHETKLKLRMSLVIRCHYIPKDRSLHNHRCENLKSYTSLSCILTISENYVRNETSIKKSMSITTTELLQTGMRLTPVKFCVSCMGIRSPS